MQDGRENPKDCRLVLGAEVQDLHGSKQAQEVLAVALSRYSAVSALSTARTQTEVALAGRSARALGTLLMMLCPRPPG